MMNYSGSVMISSDVLMRIAKRRTTFLYPTVHGLSSLLRKPRHSNKMGEETGSLF